VNWTLCFGDGGLGCDSQGDDYAIGPLKNLTISAYKSVVGKNEHDDFNMNRSSSAFRAGIDPTAVKKFIQFWQVDIFSSDQKI
jgi:hypothetical protein